MKNIEKHPNLIEYIEYAENVRVRQGGADVNVVKYLALEFAKNKTLLDYLLSR